VNNRFYAPLLAASEGKLSNCEVLVGIWSSIILVAAFNANLSYTY
jgi:hypothetical protein